MKINFHIISILLLPIISVAQDFSLENEDVILEFETTNGKKLTISKDISDKYLVYRFGDKENIELEYPKQKNNAWKKFTISNYLRGGGIENEGMDLKYLYFEIENYKYVIYQEYLAIKGKTEYGVRVFNLVSNKEIEIKANPNTIKGSLVSLIEHKKIKKGEELFR